MLDLSEFIGLELLPDKDLYRVSQKQVRQWRINVAKNYLVIIVPFVTTLLYAVTCEMTSELSVTDLSALLICVIIFFIALAATRKRIMKQRQYILMVDVLARVYGG